MNADSELIASLAQKIDDLLSPLLPSGESCALLDFPNYTNVGDSALWLGGREWLRRRKVNVVYQCDIYSYSPEVLARRLPRGPILISGGGNFGDLWPDHQRVRENILYDFPDRAVIQLPQSIHYHHAESIPPSVSAFAGHKHVTLLCRDHKSYNFARQHFTAAKVALCPDTAFLLGPLERPAPQVDMIWQRRTDAEAVSELQTEIPGVEYCDWLEEAPTPISEKAHRLWKELFAADADRHTASASFADTFEPVARERLERGCRLLSRGRVVVTDRLHGHILCILLGIPHVILDNSYGKVSGFHSAWTRESKLTHVASSPAEAFKLASDLLARLR